MKLCTKDFGGHQPCSQSSHSTFYFTTKFAPFVYTRGDGCYVRDNSYVDVVTILYIGDLTDLKVVSFRPSEFAFSSYEWNWLLILIRPLLS